MSALPPSAAIVKAVRQMDLTLRESLEFPEGRFDPRNGPGASRHSISVLIVSLIRPMSSLGNVVISDNSGQPCGGLLSIVIAGHREGYPIFGSRGLA